MVKNPPARDTDLISGPGTKIPHATGRLSNYALASQLLNLQAAITEACVC